MGKVVIIGGGPGGVAAAIRAAQLGAEVAIIEAKDIGGVCLNRGCIPLRILGNAADIKLSANHGVDFGLTFGQVKVNPGRLKTHLDDTVKFLGAGTESLLRSNGIRIVKGRGVLTPAGTVQVGTEILSADSVILATGAVWKRPDLPKTCLDAMSTSDDLVSSLEIPEKILVLGGRPWSVELATFYLVMGSRVTLASEGPLLPSMDRQIVGRLNTILKKLGMSILLNTRIDRIEKQAGSPEVFLTAKRKSSKVSVNKILVTEREPCVEGLGLEEAGIAVENGAVMVDHHLQTSRVNIYALGDLVGEPLMSHKASAQGIIAAENALGGNRTFDSHILPTVINTWPEIASVGVTEKEAKTLGCEVVLGEAPYAINSRAQCERSETGLVKLVCGARHHEVLGVHIIGPYASELISLAVLAIQLETTADELERLIPPHPSYAESLVDAARMVLGRPIYMPK